jgi:hypothetical protein
MVPTTNKYGLARGTDNSIAVFCPYYINNTGIITISNGMPPGNFTASGSKSFVSTEIVFNLN